MPDLALIWAQTPAGVIGVGGALPWHLPEDAALFRAVTTGSAVLMGRRTWSSLPARFRPLPGRRNLVLSRTPGWSADGAELVPGPDRIPATGHLWVIGGAEVYAACAPAATVALVTTVDLEVAGDVRAPVLGPGWSVWPEQPWAAPRRSRTGTGYAVALHVRDPAPVDAPWFRTLLGTLRANAAQPGDPPGGSATPPAAVPS